MKKLFGVPRTEQEAFVKENSVNESEAEELVKILEDS